MRLRHKLLWLFACLCLCFSIPILIRSTHLLFSLLQLLQTSKRIWKTTKSTLSTFICWDLCYLGRRHRMGSIVDEQMVVAVQLQHVEAQHKALQDRVRLEGDDAVQVALVL